MSPHAMEDVGLGERTDPLAAVKDLKIKKDASENSKSQDILEDVPKLKIKPRLLDDPLSRPQLARSATDPTSPSSPNSPLPRVTTLPVQPRNRSPYSRTHLRSRSTASALAAPSMTRAHSSPLTESVLYPRPSSPLARPASPLTSGRRASPLRRPIDETSFSGVDIDQTIAENSELDILPRQNILGEIDSPNAPQTPVSPYPHSTFPRSSRRRPSSPLHHLLPSPMSHHQDLKPAATLHTSCSSPALRSSSGSASSPTSAAKYNESYPGPLSYALSVSTASSVPSTPTSFRSRSPSISSLETIPDSPDAELEAAEAVERDKDTIAKLRAAAEREGSRRGSFEGNRGRGMFKDGGVGQKERKRWSVCGAERRGDLDLETIWED